MLAAVLAVSMSPVLAVAATGPKVGPKDSWDDMQKFEYNIGQLAGALNMCNNFGLSGRLRELSDLSPYGRQGWASLLGFDDLRGGRCNSYAESAEKLLDDRDKLWGYLTDKYDCPGGQCAPEDGNKSLIATCRAEADQHLMSLPVGSNEIKGVWMVRREAVGTRTPGVSGAEFNQRGVDDPGYEAWVRLGSCSGWLIIDMSFNCHPRDSFTRGECSIDGVKGF